MHSSRRFITGAVLSLPALLLAGIAQGSVYSASFDSLPTGTILTNQFDDLFGGGQGVSFSVVTGDKPDVDTDPSEEDSKTLAIFDTLAPVPVNYPGSLPGSADGDPDMAYNGGWTAGNLKNSTWAGKTVLIAENLIDDYTRNPDNTWSSGPDGLLDVPDDTTGGGALRIVSDRGLTAMGYTVLDFEPGAFCCMEFFDGSFNQIDRVAQVFFQSTPPLASEGGDPVEYGDGSANRIFVDLGNTEFTHIQFNFETSGSFGDFEFTEVPEPAHYAAAFGVIALGIAWMRRRRQRG